MPHALAAGECIDDPLVAEGARVERGANREQAASTSTAVPNSEPLTTVRRAQSRSAPAPRCRPEPVGDRPALVALRAVVAGHARDRVGAVERDRVPEVVFGDRRRRAKPLGLRPRGPAARVEVDAAFVSRAPSSRYGAPAMSMLPSSATENPSSSPRSPSNAVSFACCAQDEPEPVNTYTAPRRRRSGCRSGCRPRTSFRPARPSAERVADAGGRRADRAHCVHVVPERVYT